MKHLKLRALFTCGGSIYNKLVKQHARRTTQISHLFPSDLLA